MSILVHLIRHSRGVFLVLAIATGLVVVQVTGLASDGPPSTARPGQTPGPPAGHVAEPGADVPTAPPLETPSAAKCTSVLDLRGFDTNLGSSADLTSYVSRQESRLKEYASAAPDRRVLAGVNLVKLTPQIDFDALLAKYGLRWANTYWEATGGVRGAMAQSVGPQTLAELEQQLKGNGELPADGAVMGAFYFTTEESLGTLASLSSDPAVELVDVGRLAELDAARAAGSCGKFALPGPLWYEHERLAIPIE